MTNKKETIKHLEERLEKWTRRGSEKNIKKYAELLELLTSASDKFWTFFGDSVTTLLHDEMRETLKKQVQELR